MKLREAVLIYLRHSKIDSTEMLMYGIARLHPLIKRVKSEIWLGNHTHKKNYLRGIIELVFQANQTYETKFVWINWALWFCETGI